MVTAEVSRAVHRHAARRRSTPAAVAHAAAPGRRPGHLVTGLQGAMGDLELQVSMGAAAPGSCSSSMDRSVRGACRQAPSATSRRTTSAICRTAPWRDRRPDARAAHARVLHGSACPPQLVPATARRGQPSLGGRGVVRGGDGTSGRSGHGPGRSAVRRAAPVRALTAQGPSRPQNLFLIAGLERDLRRRLGDPLLIQRALREAASRSQPGRQDPSSRRAGGTP